MPTTPFRTSATKHNQSQQTRSFAVVRDEEPEPVFCRDCKWRSMGLYKKESEHDRWECHVPDPEKINFVTGGTVFKRIREYSDSGAAEYCIKINRDGKCEDYRSSDKKRLIDAEKLKEAQRELREERSAIEQAKPMTFWQRLWHWFTRRNR